MLIKTFILILTREREQWLEINRFCPSALQCSAVPVPICRPTKSNPLILLFLPFSSSPLFISPAATFSPNLALVTLSDERSHANLSPQSLFFPESLFAHPITANCQLATIVHNSPHWSTKGAFLPRLSPLIVNISNPPTPSSSPSKELVPVFSPNDDASPSARIYKFENSC